MNPRRRFFDRMAGDWDVRADAERLRRRLIEELPHFGLAAGESILDVGCGTGNLTAELGRSVGATGRVVAVDLSLAMIEKARAKRPAGPIRWIQCDAALGPLRGQIFDRVFCYSAWPHFPAPEALAEELRRLLRDGGRLHVWHSIPREAVNAIHRTAGAEVAEDLLPPAPALCGLLERSGYRIEESRDDGTGFLITARKGARSG